jgi:hypothetical protein
LVVGCWLLVVGCWLLVVGCCPPPPLWYSGYSLPLVSGGNLLFCVLVLFCHCHSSFSSSWWMCMAIVATTIIHCCLLCFAFVFPATSQQHPVYYTKKKKKKKKVYKEMGTLTLFLYSNSLCGSTREERMWGSFASCHSRTQNKTWTKHKVSLVL